MIIFLREWVIQIINFVTQNFSCRKKNHNTLYKSLNNIDHLKKEQYFYFLSQKEKNGIISIKCT